MNPSQNWIGTVVSVASKPRSYFDFMDSDSNIINPSEHLPNTQVLSLLYVLVKYLYSGKLPLATVAK